MLVPFLERPLQKRLAGLEFPGLKTAYCLADVLLGRCRRPGRTAIR